MVGGRPVWGVPRLGAFLLPGVAERYSQMVALAVRDFGQTPVVCLARPMLMKAEEAVCDGQYILAGCQLREAVRLFLVAECAYHGCCPAERREDAPPMALVKALREAGHLDPGVQRWLTDVLGNAKKLAHCKHVDRELIQASIGMVHAFLDHSPYLVQPNAAGRLS